MPRPGQPEARLALALVVRDEERFLGAHLSYHGALGVSRAYVYLDRCTDATPAIAASFPWVVPIARDRAPGDRYMSDNQVPMPGLRPGRARADGFDWLLHLDPDEFAWGDNRPGRLARLLGRPGPVDPVEAGSLTAMLARSRPATEVVRLRTKEVIPQPVEPGSPFWKLHYFQDRGIWARPILDPTDGRIKPLRFWLGGHRGKSIVRTSARVLAESAHGWRRADGAAGGPVVVQDLGYHYHFVVVDGEQWRAKYRKFAEYPGRWSSGRPVRFPKQAWKEASLGMSPGEALRYFDEWVAVRPEVLGRRADGRKVVRETHVEDVLAGVYPPARRERDGPATPPGSP